MVRAASATARRCAATSRDQPGCSRRGQNTAAAIIPRNCVAAASGSSYEQPRLSLDRHLIRRPHATFVLRVRGDGLASLGLLDGDELLVDRSLEPRPGRVLVVIHDGEHRVGLFKILDGRANLVSDVDAIPLTSDVRPFGVATIGIRHLPLGLPRPDPTGT